MKKIFYTMAVAAALFAGYTAYEFENKSNLEWFKLVNIEALAAEGEKVTCEYDPGDTCKVGVTDVPDWDEDTWF
ncbi:MAG: hypothetical protein IKU35_10085 [Bacteroidaceae bacterium]|nr:hypothetical protein [Bacteroidaceae bacterium]